MNKPIEQVVIVSKSSQFLINYQAKLFKLFPSMNVTVLETLVFQNHFKKKCKRLWIIDFASHKREFCLDIKHKNFDDEVLLILPNETLHSNIYATNLMTFNLLDANAGKAVLKAVVAAILENIHCFGPLIHLWLKHYEANYSSPSQYGITRKEVDVLNEFLKGKKYEQAAKAIGIKESTYRKHLENIVLKLGLKHNREIIDFIRKAHWCHFETGEIIWF